jgi:predicted dehydrogenase
MSASGRMPVEAVSDCDVVVANLEELLAYKVELVIVASPAPFHAEHAVPLIEAGVPTLIEKPVTTTLSDIVKIEHAIANHNTPVAIGYCLRYLPSTKMMNALLESKKVGVLYNANIEIGQYLPDWRPNKSYRETVSANKHLGGGALFELSHELDFSQWLLGPLELKLATLRSSEELGLEVEDIVDIVATNEDAVVTNIHLDFVQRQANRKCSFIGSKGRLDWDLINNQISLSSSTGCEILYDEPCWDKNQMYILMLEDFIRMIDGKSNSCVTIKEAAKTIAFIEKINQLASD